MQILWVSLWTNGSLYLSTCGSIYLSAIGVTALSLLGGMCGIRLGVGMAL